MYDGLWLVSLGVGTMVLVLIVGRSIRSGQRSSWQTLMLTASLVGAGFLIVVGGIRLGDEIPQTYEFNFEGEKFSIRFPSKYEAKTVGADTVQVEAIEGRSRFSAIHKSYNVSIGIGELSKRVVERLESSSLAYELIDSSYRHIDLRIQFLRNEKQSQMTYVYKRVYLLDGLYLELNIEQGRYKTGDTAFSDVFFEVQIEPLNLGI